MRMKSGILIGGALAVLYTALAAMADGITKAVAQGYAAPQLYAIAGLAVAGLCLLMPPEGRRGPRRGLPRTRFVGLTALRAGLAIVATLGFFHAFRDLALAEFMVLIGTMPLMGAVLSGLILREAPRPAGWLALAVGSAGVLLLFPDGIQSVTRAHGVGLGACFLGTLSMVISRQITRREAGTLAQVFYPNLALGLAMALALPFIWRPMPPGDMALVGVYAATLFGARWIMVLALKRAPAHVVMPILNLQFIWMVLIGAAAFGEVPTAGVIAGSIVVIAAGLYLVWDETRPEGAPLLPRLRPFQMEKLVPQPQLDVALGLSMTNRAPMSSSEKSITAPARNGSETLSTTTR